MTPRRPRDGRCTNRRGGSRRGGRRTQNSPSENPSPRSIKNEEIAGGNVTTSEELRRQ
jgi:hypothetical protein